MPAPRASARTKTASLRQKGVADEPKLSARTRSATATRSKSIADHNAEQLGKIAAPRKRTATSRVEKALTKPMGTKDVRGAAAGGSTGRGARKAAGGAVGKVGAGNGGGGALGAQKASGGRTKAVAGSAGRKPKAKA